MSTKLQGSYVFKSVWLPKSTEPSVGAYKHCLKCQYSLVGFRGGTQVRREFEAMIKPRGEGEGGNCERKQKVAKGRDGR